MISVVLASPEPSCSGITSSMVKDPQSGRLIPEFRVNIINKTNRQTLFRLRIIDDISGDFTFRPSNIGLLSSEDSVAEMGIAAKSKAKFHSLNNVELSIEAAYFGGKKSKGGVVDAVVAWRNVKKTNISILRVQLEFLRREDISSTTMETNAAIVHLLGIGTGKRIRRFFGDVGRSVGFVLGRVARGIVEGFGLHVPSQAGNNNGSSNDSSERRLIISYIEEDDSEQMVTAEEVATNEDDGVNNAITANEGSSEDKDDDGGVTCKDGDGEDDTDGITCAEGD